MNDLAPAVTGNLPPTGADLARLKTVFSAAIADGVEGAASLRHACLAAYRDGNFSAVMVDLAIDMIATMREAQASPAAAPAPAEVPFRKGQVVTNAAGEIVRLYARKADGKLYGKVQVDGTWEYAPGAMRGVRHLTADEAAAYGHATDHCVFCSRALEDLRSTTVGYGPVCAENMGLPWGAKG